MDGSVRAIECVSYHANVEMYIPCSFSLIDVFELIFVWGIPFGGWVGEVRPRLDLMILVLPVLLDANACIFVWKPLGRMNSSAFATLNASLVDVWGRKVAWWDVLDCLMTTACTLHELPDGEPRPVSMPLLGCNSRVCRVIH